MDESDGCMGKGQHPRIGEVKWLLVNYDLFDARQVLLQNR